MLTPPCKPGTIRAVVLTAALTMAITLGVHAMFAPQSTRAQDSNVGQISAGSPLPVFVTNSPSLPQGFVPNSRWRYTTWTMPSVITWVATVQRVSGAWALLTVTDGAVSTSRWYYVPNMEGSWQQE